MPRRQARTRSSPQAAGNRTSLAWRRPRPLGWAWPANWFLPAWCRVEVTNMIEMVMFCSTIIAATVEKANAALTLLGFGASVNSNDVKISGSQLGAGYGISTPAMVKALRLMASREGLLLDPVYGGKAFAGLLADISAGRFEAG